MRGWRLLGRSGCHLCDEFLEEFAAAFPGQGLVQDDVDARDEWRTRYGRRVPVLIDARGEPVCETFFDPDRVRAAATRDAGASAG